MENLKKALKPQPVLNRAGKPSGVFKHDAAGANKALELLGKLCRSPPMW